MSYLMPASGGPFPVVHFTALATGLFEQLFWPKETIVGHLSQQALLAVISLPAGSSVQPVRLTRPRNLLSIACL
jgi:hypothetical protein